MEYSIKLTQKVFKHKKFRLPKQAELLSILVPEGIL